MTAPQTPSTLDHIITTIGIDDTARLIEMLGGTRWYVGDKPWPTTHPVVAALGEEKTELLRVAFAGDTLEIPRDKTIIDGLMYADQQRGMGMNDLVTKYRQSVRQIRRRIQRHLQRMLQAQQPDLFG